MNKYKLINFTLISVILTDSFQYIVNAGTSISNATLIASLFNYFSIAILIYIARNEGFGIQEIPKKISFLYKLWIFWGVFEIVRSIFLAKDYWDWKSLFLDSISLVCISLTFFFGKNLSYARSILKFIIKYLFPFGFLYIPITLVTNLELYSRIMIASSLYILFIPYFKWKQKFLVILVSIVSIVMMLEFRSNIIKIVFSSSLILIYYLRSYIPLWSIKLLSKILFALPIVLFVLAVNGTYNVFEEIEQDNEKYTTVDQYGEEKSLATDTRTGLYIEVLSSMDQSGDWILGKGAIGTYYSNMMLEMRGDARRYGSEVNIMNILLHYGIIGVIIYFLLLITVSTIAITQSNNTLAKMIGLFIAFRWTYSFVEEFTQYDLNFYFFWLAIGLVSSASFRRMNDKEIIHFLNL